MGNIFTSYKKQYDQNSTILNNENIKDFNYIDKYAEITTFFPIDNWKTSSSKESYAGYITILIYENENKENLISCINAYTWEFYTNIKREGFIKDLSFNTVVINRFDLLYKGSIIRFLCNIKLDDVEYNFKTYTTFNKFDNYPIQLIINTTPKEYATIHY